MKTRIIPVLLLKGGGFYKTRKFKDPVYLGDPINILRIFNDKETDELAILDITATPDRRGPDFERLKDLAGECFMPLAYGGGLREVSEVRRLIRIGFEKAILNTAALESPELIREAAKAVGSQSVVVCIDAKKSLLGRYEVVTRSGQKKTGIGPTEWARQAESMGAGEIIINSVDRDGTMEGYDLGLVQSVTSVVSIPVIACGGAANTADLALAVKRGGASACAAGAMFVFQGKHRAVLINMPTASELDRTFSVARA